MGREERREGTGRISVARECRFLASNSSPFFVMEIIVFDGTEFETNE